MNKVIICGLCIFICFLSCTTKEKFKWYTQNGVLKLDSFYSDGTLSCQQSFMKDSLTKKGGALFYYPNGKIEKWLWYDIKHQYPLGGVYYDTNGRMESIVGSGFLQIDNINDSFNFEMMAPPNCKVSLEIKDSFHNTLYEVVRLIPINLESSLLFNGRVNIWKDHRYFANYKIEDTLLNLTLEEGLPLIVADTSYISPASR